MLHHLSFTFWKNFEYFQSYENLLKLESFQLNKTVSESPKSCVSSPKSCVTSFLAWNIWYIMYRTMWYMPSTCDTYLHIDRGKEKKTVKYLSDDVLNT